MNTEKLLEQLNTLNDYYIWSIKELEKITKQYKKIEDKEEYDPKKDQKLEVLRKKYIELNSRHEANEAIFKKLITDSRQYFLDKYNIDILKIANRYL